MRKLLSLVLALALVLGSFPAFADATPTAGEQLQGWKIVQGDLDADKALTREMAITYFIRVLGEEKAALAYTEATKFTDVPAGHWAAKYIAYAEAKGYTKGMGNGKFGLGLQASATQMASFMVRGLGYTGLTDAEELTKSIELKLNTGIEVPADGKVTRAMGFQVLINTLNTPKKDGKEALKYVLGLEKAPVAPVVVKVASAVALNSKNVEVKLTDAVTAIDAAAFTVKAGETANAVTAAKLAPYSTTGKVVIVTVEKDLAAGTLYTVAAGETKANFGGISADTVKPTVSKVESTDYNEIKVTFSEAVDATKLVVTATEKYGTKAALTATFKEYASSSEVVFTTADQKASTLYGVVIEGAVDFAGNALVKDEAKTFVGQAKPTAKQSVVSPVAASSVKDSRTVVLTFGEKVDAATAVVVANYVVTEKYGAKAAVVVEKAEINKDADGNDLPKEVKLTFAADTKAATLYNVEVKNVGTLYGVALDTDKDETTFVGVAADTAKPSKVIVGTNGNADSNTQITVKFEDANGADKLAADVDVALVTVTEKYGAKAALTLTKKEVKDNTIVFTTSAQSGSTLYDVKVVKGIKDAKGNVSTDDLTTTFVGSAVATKITAIDTVADNSATGTIRVTFDKNYGTGGLDVASYFIDGGIGYPTKVAKVTGDLKSVDITVPKTSTGTLYKLTVKNVNNADGVAMDAAGITKTFVGQGGAPAAALKLEAAVALNNVTFKLFFNKKIEEIDFDTTQAGIQLPTAAKTAIVGAATVTDTNALFQIDPVDEKVLVVTLKTTGDNANIKVAGKNASTGVYEVQFTDSALATDNNKIALAPIDTDATKIKIDGLVAQDARTVLVYFNQTVRFVNPAHLTVDHDNNSATAAVAFTNAVAANADSTQWLLSLSDANKLTSTQSLAVTVQATPAITVGGAADNHILFSTTAADLALLVAGKTGTIAPMSSVYAVAVDSRALTVYFSEAMDADSITTNPSAFVANGNTATKATYDAETKTAKVWFNAAIGTGEKDLVITKNTLLNLAKTNAVAKKDDAATNLTVKYAGTDAAAAKVGFKSVATDSAANTITITFDQNITAAELSNINLIDKYFKVTYNGQVLVLDGNVTASVVTAGNLTGTLGSVVLTLTTDIEASKELTISVVDGSDLVGGYNGSGLNKDATKTIVTK